MKIAIVPSSTPTAPNCDLHFSQSQSRSPASGATRLPTLTQSLHLRPTVDPKNRVWRSVNMKSETERSIPTAISANCAGLMSETFRANDAKYHQRRWTIIVALLVMAIVISFVARLQTFLVIAARFVVVVSISCTEAVWKHSCTQSPKENAAPCRSTLLPAVLLFVAWAVECLIFKKINGASLQCENPSSRA